MCCPLPRTMEQLSQGLSPGLSGSTTGTSQSLVLPCWRSGGTLLLGCLVAHLARVTRWHQEFLPLPCPWREVAPDSLVKRDSGYHVGPKGYAHPGGLSVSSWLTFR